VYVDGKGLSFDGGITGENESKPQFYLHRSAPLLSCIVPYA